MLLFINFLEIKNMNEIRKFFEGLVLEIKNILNSLSFFQYFVVAALTYVIWSPFFVPDYIIDGEIIYTAGFSIVLYLIWVELFSKSNDLLVPAVTSSGLSSFWLKYKIIESDIISLFYSKITLLNSILVAFSLTTIILKSLSFIKFNNLVYRISLQTLNRLKLKNKSLPLQ
jgi:hypothetical protein